MTMDAEQRRAFVREHRTCIFAFQRKQGPPSMSVVYYTRPLVEEMARRENRVLIRLSPDWSVYSPPVHLNAGDDGSKMKHGLAERMPWKL
jgi:hypothetical protein